MLRLVLVVLALAMAGCSIPADFDDVPAAVREATPFDMDLSRCAEVLAMFAVDRAHAREYVPEGYTPLLDPSGRAIAFSGLKVCEDIAIDNESIGPGSTVDSGVFIEAPDGTDGFHYYQTWWLSDNPILVARLALMGWNTSVVEESTVTPPTVGGMAGETVARVGWAEGAYGITARVAAGPPGSAPHAVGWYDGPLGTVRVVKDLPGDTFGGGPATFAGEGPMADLVGGDGRAGSALWSVYDLTGRVEFVG